MADNDTQARYLAFDLGASSGRAVVGTLDGDQIRMDVVHRFETPMREDERLYWNLPALERAVEMGLERALETGPIKSCSVDSWAVDYVPLGADGEPLCDPCCYRDPRTKGAMERALERVPAADIYNTTGIQFMPINTLYQVLVDYETEPELVEQARTRLLIADYLNYRLSGRAAAELTMASTTQLLDVRRRRWADDLMDRFGIDPATWPEIVPPGTRLGALRPQYGDAGVEVVAGCSHDTACAVAATPAREGGPPWAYLSCGTWSLLGVERAAPVLTEAAREASFTNELGLDGSVRFLKNLTGLWVLQECERAWEAAGQQFDYDTLLREAREAPPSGCIVDLDDPRFQERGRMPEKLSTFCHEHDLPVPGTRGALVRVILESLADDYRRKLDKLEQLTGEEIDVVHLVGGGARNDLLCQWTADACACRVVAGPAEATALGNLLVQARTMGDLSPGTTIRDVVHASTELYTYQPAGQAC